MGPTRVFSSRFGRVLTPVAAVLALTVVVSGLVTEGAAALLRLGPPAALALLAVWALFWRPEVVVSDGEVVVVNVLRTVRVPWPTFVEARVEWSLVVVTTRGRVSAWVAPRGGRRAGDDVGPGDVGVGAAREARRDRLTAALWPEPAAAEAVAGAVAARHAALRDAGFLDGAERARTEGGVAPQVTWHVRTLATALVLAALCAAVAVLG